MRLICVVLPVILFLLQGPLEAKTQPKEPPASEACKTYFTITQADNKLTDWINTGFGRQYHPVRWRTGVVQPWPKQWNPQEITVPSSVNEYPFDRDDPSYTRSVPESSVHHWPYTTDQLEGLKLWAMQQTRKKFRRVCLSDSGAIWTLAVGIASGPVNCLDQGRLIEPCIDVYGEYPAIFLYQHLPASGQNTSPSYFCLLGPYGPPQQTTEYAKRLVEKALGYLYKANQ